MKLKGTGLHFLTVFTIFIWPYVVELLIVLTTAADFVSCANNCFAHVEL